jgi:hypothetical protein
VVFLLAGLNLFAALNGLLRWQFLETLDITLPPWALLLPRIVWAAALLVTGWCLLRLKPWARIAAPAAVLFYQLTFIIQQMAFARQTYTRGRLPFALILAVLSALLVTWIVTRPRMHAAFNHDTIHPPHFDPGELPELPDEQGDYSL